MFLLESVDWETLGGMGTILVITTGAMVKIVQMFLRALKARDEAFLGSMREMTTELRDMNSRLGRVEMRIEREDSPR